MKIEVGSYEAKTKLPELLRGVQTGKRYTITLRGEAVAELVPPQGIQRQDLAVAVEDMRAFMRARARRDGGGTDEDAASGSRSENAQTPGGIAGMAVFPAKRAEAYAPGSR